MNVRQRTSFHQYRLLKDLARERLVLRVEGTCVLRAERYYYHQLGPFSWFMTLGDHKDRTLCGSHERKAFSVLYQRGWLVVQPSGRIDLAPAVRRSMGVEPLDPWVEKKTVTMSRTRAARVQVVESQEEL